MSFLDTFDLRISTLSPVHVGCGEDYEPTSYVIDKNRLYTFDPVALIQTLSPAERNEFSRIVEEGKGQTLSRIQRFFFRHKAKALDVGYFAADVIPEVQTFYDSRIGQTAQRERDGKNVLNRLEISRTAFNPINGQSILPGSSLKGAIRTALLENLRGGQRFPVEKPEKRRETEIAAQNMQKKILGGDFSTDPLRFLKISDATFRPRIKSKDQMGEIREIERRPAICFQVNRKKHPNQFSASGNINTLLEYVPGKLSNAFSVQLVIENKAWYGRGMPGLQLDFAKLADACNSFYLERLAIENKILAANRYATAWVDFIQKNLEPSGRWGKIIESKQGFLLRVGRHSGAESITVDAPRCIKIMKGKGASPSYKSEATTLWLAAQGKDQQEDMQPFGWVFIQCVPHNTRTLP